MPKHLDLSKKSFNEVYQALKAVMDRESVESIYLQYCKLTQENAGTIANELSNFPNLRALDVGSNRNLSEEGIAIIAAACSKLEELVVRECGITSEHAGQVAAALQNLSLLRKLDLGSNKHLGVGAANIIAVCSNLEALYINGCGITSEHAGQVAAALKNLPLLRKLDLGSNKRLGAGAANIIAACTNLEELDINECNINAHVATALGSLPQLRKLDLGWNRNFSAEGIAIIAAACSKLEELVVADCGITSGNAAQVATALGSLPQLRKLDLGWNGDLGVGVADIIAECSKLEELYIDECGIPKEHLPHLKTILEKRPHLLDYSGSSKTFTNTILIVNEEIHKPGVEYFKQLCVSLGLGEFIGVDQPANKVFSRGNQLACASRLRYIIDNFDKFEECDFDKNELQAALKYLENQMQFLPNWFSGNGVCKVLNDPSPLASLPKEMLLEIGSYLKTSVARVTEATEPPTITIPGAIAAVAERTSTSSMSL